MIHTHWSSSRISLKMWFRFSVTEAEAVAFEIAAGRLIRPRQRDGEEQEPPHLRCRKGDRPRDYQRGAIEQARMARADDLDLGDERFVVVEVDMSLLSIHDCVSPMQDELCFGRGCTAQSM